MAHITYIHAQAYMLDMTYATCKLLSSHTWQNDVRAHTHTHDAHTSKVDKELKSAFPASVVRRLPAVLQSPGYLGCLMSHIKALQVAYKPWQLIVGIRISALTIGFSLLTSGFMLNSTE